MKNKIVMDGNEGERGEKGTEASNVYRERKLSRRTEKQQTRRGHRRDPERMR